MRGITQCGTHILSFLIMFSLDIFRYLLKITLKIIQGETYWLNTKIFTFPFSFSAEQKLIVVNIENHGC